MSLDHNRSGFTLLGAITGHYGVKGWVRVRSFTRPADEILQYAPWSLLSKENAGLSGRVLRAGAAEADQGSWRVLASRRQKNGLVVQLEGVSNRDDAEPLIGRQIAIPDGEMPSPPSGEYYWADLIGLRVINLQDEVLGVVDHLLETGANDVLVVEDRSGSVSLERLIPWGPDVVESVDLENREMRVDWGLDY